jgi:CRP-like cAMP-binding protein
LNAGDSFGELALIDSRQGRRAARIVCTQDCAMGVISAEDYHQTLSKIENKKREAIIEFMRGMPYFKSLVA